MTNETLLLTAIGLVAISGFPGLVPAALVSGAGGGVRATALHRISVGILTCGAAVGLLAAGRELAGISGAPLQGAWALPGAELALELDTLSAFFVIPVLLIGALGAWFGMEYWPLGGKQPHPGRLILFYGLTTAAMAVVATARNGVLFLAAWEVMAISAYFLVTTEDDDQDVRSAGWIYFVATHASTLLLFALFGLIWAAQGSLDLKPLATGSVSPALLNGIFLTALAAFGIKAGLFPVHVWLPPAHASAPSHVSALMSGVLIKMGVYGMVRVTWMLGVPMLWWGELLLGLGVVAGVLGVAFALGQHDLKRLLAYHSIENIGIIFMGLGLAVSGMALGDARWIALGLPAALLHTWNHGLFKTLLFLAAGSVLHRTHSREIDRFGGLAKPMPRTAGLFLIGAVAICGLPPLNGFISELLLYLGMFAGMAQRSGGILSDPAVLGRWLQPALGIPALALIGGLALACFVKVYAAVFLGEPRTPQGQGARECGSPMLVPMGILAALCIAIGLLPGQVAPWLDRAIGAWSRTPSGLPLTGLAPLGTLTAVAASLWLVLGAALAYAWLRRAARSQTGNAARGVAAVSIGTWDCGFSRPTPRIQYTAASFAQLLIHMWRWVLMPVTHYKGSRPAQVFPASSKFASHVPDVVLDRVVMPGLHAIAWTVGWLRLFQRGRMQEYLLYVFITFLILLLFK